MNLNLLKLNTGATPKTPSTPINWASLNVKISHKINSNLAEFMRVNNKKHILEKRRRYNAKMDCVDSDEDRGRDIVHEMETYGKVNQLNPQLNMYKAYCA